MMVIKREHENCMDFIEAVHRDRLCPLMYCHAELIGELDIEMLKSAVSVSSQFVPEIQLEEKIKELYNVIFVKQYTEAEYRISIGKYRFTKDTKEILLKVTGLLSKYIDLEVD